MDVEIKIDSSSGISIASRLGQGRLKHLEFKQLAIQTCIRRRVVRLGKVDSAHNHGDLLTKNLPPKLHEYHREALGLRSETRAIALVRPVGHGGGAWASVGRGVRVC